MDTLNNITIMDLAGYLISGQTIEFNAGGDNWIEGTVAGVDIHHLHAKYKDLNGRYTSFMPISYQLSPNHPKHMKVRLKK